MNELTIKANLNRLAEHVAAHPDAMGTEEIEDMYLEHFFAPGMYGRRMFIPAGLLLIGKIHRHSHLNVMTYGTLQIVSTFGSDLKMGPDMWQSEAGIQRNVLGINDAEIITLHANPTDTQDMAELEALIIAPDYEALEKL